MQIVVCIKQIIDPDVPPAKFRVDTNNDCVIPPEGIPPVLNPYDALAVEAALRIKEKIGDVKITLLSVGDSGAEDVIKYAIGMGGDEGILLKDDSFAGSDGFGIAEILTKAIQKLGKYNLILCGRQAADWDQGMVGAVIAENLNIPVIERARSIEVKDDKFEIWRMVSNGIEIVEASFPALVTVSSELGQARIPTGWGIISAARKEIPVWTSKNIDVNLDLVGESSRRNNILELYIPVNERKCEMVTAEKLEEAITVLALKIKERIA